MTNQGNNPIEKALRNKNFSALIDAIPYAQIIGLQCIPIGDTALFSLPKNDNNIGNPTLPALHGGVMAGFMEMSAALHVMMTTQTQCIPKIVDFSIDYLSPGRHCDSYAQCDVVRQGRKIANVSITAWQKSRDKPIATARAHFLINR